jgi:hypothetical protein
MKLVLLSALLLAMIGGAHARVASFTDKEKEQDLVERLLEAVVAKSHDIEETIRRLETKLDNLQMLAQDTTDGIDYLGESQRRRLDDEDDCQLEMMTNTSVCNCNNPLYSTGTSYWGGLEGGGQLAVNGGNLTIEGNATLEGSVTIVSATVEGGLDVFGDSNFENDLLVIGDMQVNGQTIFEGDIDFVGKNEKIDIEGDMVS